MSTSLRFHSPLRSIAALLLTLPLLLASSGCKTPGETAYEEAKELQKRNFTDKAIIRYEEAAVLLKSEDGRADKAYYKLASIYKARGSNADMLKAVENYEKAIVENPDEFKYHHRLIGAYTWLQQFDDAQGAYDAIIDHPGLKYAIKDKKALEQRQVDLDVARENFAKGLDIFGNPLTPLAADAATDDPDTADAEAGGDGGQNAADTTEEAEQGEADAESSEDAGRNDNE